MANTFPQSPPPSGDNFVYYLGDTNRWPRLKTIATPGKILKDEWFTRDSPLLTDAELAQIVNRGRLEYEFSQYDTHDFFVLTTDCTIVSGRVRDCIEALDPGLHQFVQYEICEPPKLPPHVERRLYLMNVGRREDFIDLDRSEIGKSISGLLHLATKPEPMIFGKSGWRPSCHIWKSKLRVDDQRIFVSQEMRNGLQTLEILWLRTIEVRLT